MDERPQTELEHYGHLGIISAIFKDYGIGSRINELLPKTSNNQKITHSEAIQCMIYQGLGFAEKRMYAVSDFFSDKPTSTLFRKNVSHKDLNDDVLARALDAIHKYGPSRFFSDVAFKILADNDLISKFVHMDSSPTPLYGRKYSKDGNIKVRYGHSKGRKDLKQLVDLLMTSEGGIPFFEKTYSGNISDREIFQESMVTVQEYFKKYNCKTKTATVADTALYSKKFLLNKKITGDWVTRVPESIDKAKFLLSKDQKSVEWTKINENYKFWEKEMTYAGVKQRWIVVRNRKAKYKELATLEKKLKKLEEQIEKRSKALMSKVFLTNEALKIEVKRFKKSYPLFEIRNSTIGHYKKKRDKKRPVKVGVKACIGYNQDHKKVTALKNRKGLFIVATNILDESTTSEELVGVYCDRNRNIESCFKLLKDSTYKLRGMFLKRTDRIEAMMAVMALSLFVNNLGQHKLRESLSNLKQTLPNQLKKEISNPTLKWAFWLMKKVVKIETHIFGATFTEFKGLTGVQKIIIDCFGPHAKAIYGYP